MPGGIHKHLRLVLGFTKCLNLRQVRGRLKYDKFGFEWRIEGGGGLRVRFILQEEEGRLKTMLTIRILK